MYPIDSEIRALIVQNALVKDLRASVEGMIQRGCPGPRDELGTAAAVADDIAVADGYRTATILSCSHTCDIGRGGGRALQGQVGRAGD